MKKVRGSTHRVQGLEHSGNVKLGPLSHSQSQTLLDCSGAWWLRYVENLRAPIGTYPQVVGKAVHEALADYFTRPPTERSIEGFENAYEQAWAEHLKAATEAHDDSWLAQEQEKLDKHYRAGKQMLAVFWRKFQNSPGVPMCHVERELSMSLCDDTSFRCVPDAYYLDGVRVVLLSHKTRLTSMPDKVGHLTFNPQHFREAAVLRDMYAKEGQPFLAVVRYYFLCPSGADAREIPILDEQIDQALRDLVDIRDYRNRVAMQQQPHTFNLRPSCPQRCEYADICTARTQGWDVEAVKRGKYVLDTRG